MRARKQVLLTLSAGAAISVIMIIVASFTADVIRSLGILLGAFSVTLAVFCTVHTAKTWRPVQLPFLAGYIVAGKVAYGMAGIMVVLLVTRL